MRLPNLVGLALMTGVVLSSCAHVSGSGAVSEEAANEQAASELREHHRHHHRGSVTQFIAMSLDTIGEDDAQRPQIEKLQGALSECMAPTREIETKLVLAYADGLAAEGSLPTAKIDTTIEELNATSGAVYECSVETLNKLHALLTPAEREVVADKVQAHWEIWREVNEDKEGGTRAAGGLLADLADELKLTTGQLDQMSAALNKAFASIKRFDAKQAGAHVMAFAAAFVFEKFDARAVMPDVNSRFAAHGAQRMALFYETVTPFLQPQQRATLAVLLREHANHTTTVSAK